MVIALIDESERLDSQGIYYVMAAAIILEDVAAGRAAARSTIAGVKNRSRPFFHWNEEGTTARINMVEALVNVGACAHVSIHHPTGRRKQEEARAKSFGELVPLLIHEGVDQLIIERRMPEDDARDHIVISRLLKEFDCQDAFATSWQGKDEPLLWFPDGVCGAVGDWALQKSEIHYKRLQAEGVVTNPIYLC